MISIKPLELASCIFVLLFAVGDFCSAQEAPIIDKHQDLAAKRLERVKIRAQSIGSLFSDLSLSYDIPIGLEIAVKDDEFANYHLDLKKGTLSDLLTQFVTQNREYTWQIKDGTVNVFPRDNYRDPALVKILSAEIENFSVKENTSCWDLEKSLVSTPEVSRICKAYGITPVGLNFTGLYFPQLGRHFTLDVSNMTLKAILNRVIKESPTTRCWLIKRYIDDQTFYIRLGARHEDSPPTR